MPRTRCERTQRGRIAVACVALFVALSAFPAQAYEAPPVVDPAAPEARVHDNNQYGPVADGTGASFRVYAYQEGLVGHTTANGHVIQPEDYFVALPCFCVLSSKGGAEFQVKVEYKGRSLILPVWDVGPWNIDDNYWDPPSQRKWSALPQGYPQAAAAYYDGFNGGKDDWGRVVTSPGGMDIADGAFHELGMTGSDWVTVTFLWLSPPHYELPELPAMFPDIPSRYWDEPPFFAPAEPITDGRYGYIPETRHNVPNDLLTFWYTTGGWRIFGLPITEFFRQAEISGEVRFVQYFERAVLQLHIPDDGSPPWVTADLLGYQTYIDPDARKPIAPYTSTEHSRYFPETQHSLSHGFKVFWEQNGGLTSFGYPLSEEWSRIMPDGRKVVMQVFERARFEWWPDKVGTGEEITLGLLTVEILQRDGWLE
ncbi:MAG: hypothetical protein DCC58_06280 [Chloroflexi bacterium]|nr:MAG: hypothetical protein DCC58_06280 [Chloroflexota bacterium]